MRTLIILTSCSRSMHRAAPMIFASRFLPMRWIALSRKRLVPRSRYTRGNRTRVPTSRMRAMFIRAYRPDDYAAIIDICRRTGAGGQDATDRLQHPELMGAEWAAPYVEFEPEHALVIVDDAAQVVGYALGVVDTEAFESLLDAQ